MPKIEDWRYDDHTAVSPNTDVSPDTFELHSHTVLDQWAETITAPDLSGSGVSTPNFSPPFAPATITEWPKVEFGICYVCGTLEDGITVVCGLCKDAIRTMREYMLERIKREIAEFAKA